MKILVSGATGLVGRAVVLALLEKGHDVTALTRTPKRRMPKGIKAIGWDVDTQQCPSSCCPPDSLEGFDAVVHLAGENIASGRWTPELKAEMAYSRKAGTELLVNSLLKCQQKPHTFLSASAIGYYGANTPLNTTELGACSDPKDFLAQTCQVWERAVAPATAAGMRTAQLRFGMILSPHGGALGNMLPIFKLGGGGPLGSGKQWMSWVSIDDVVGAVLHVLTDPIGQQLSGPINVTSPHPVTNNDFTKALGKAVHRPAFMPVPALALKLLLGEMAENLLLSSSHVLSARLQESGYTFQHPFLEDALKALV